MVLSIKNVHNSECKVSSTNTVTVFSFITILPGFYWGRLLSEYHWFNLTKSVSHSLRWHLSYLKGLWLIGIILMIGFNIVSFSGFGRTLGSSHERMTGHGWSLHGFCLTGSHSHGFHHCLGGTHIKCWNWIHHKHFFEHVLQSYNNIQYQSFGLFSFFTFQLTIEDIVSLSFIFSEFFQIWKNIQTLCYFFSLNFITKFINLSLVSSWSVQIYQVLSIHLLGKGSFALI